MNSLLGRLLAVVLAFSLATLVAAPLARADEAADAAYKAHMENGVKLYQDGNHDAALTEFEAAYRAHPKAAPLLDQALCHKARFRYAKAIAALERALRDHKGELTPADQKASEDAIQEMRALLGYVIVRVRPPNAMVNVDGERGAIDEALPVAPGRHKIAATAEGFGPVETTIEIASGERREVRLDLPFVSAYVSIVAPDPRAQIFVDQRPVGRGAWTGLLPAGAHVLSLVAEERSFSSAFIAPAGGRVQLYPGGGVIPRLLPRTPEPPPPPPAPRPPLPVHRGPYVVAEASFGTQTQPRSFNGDAPNGAAAIYGGYRLNNVVGLAVLLEYVQDSPSGLSTVGASFKETSLTMQSFRFGANLRLTSRGTSFRFLANGAIGGSYDSLKWAPGSGRTDASGIDPFLRVAEGFEFDLGGVLIGSTLQEVITAPASIDRQFSGPLLDGSIAVHVGYGRW